MSEIGATKAILPVTRILSMAPNETLTAVSGSGSIVVTVTGAHSVDRSRVFYAG